MIEKAFVQRSLFCEIGEGFVQWRGGGEVVDAAKACDRSSCLFLNIWRRGAAGDLETSPAMFVVF